jgi:hypothetical protein
MQMNFTSEILLELRSISLMNYHSGMYEASVNKINVLPVLTYKKICIYEWMYIFFDSQFSGVI